MLLYKKLLSGWKGTQNKFDSHPKAKEKIINLLKKVFMYYFFYFAHVAI